MFKLFDRYVLKEIIPPFALGLTIYTFVLLMNQILLLSEMFIDRGVALITVLALLVYLIPSVLAFTVPMSVLMGILAGLSRMSSDLEITALKTLGIDNKRLIRPILLFSFCGFLVTALLTLYLAPRANYKWVQTLSRSVLAKVQLRIPPREFNESIPDTMIYVQNITKDKTWENIIVEIHGSGKEPSLIVAEKGRMNFFLDEERATLELYNAVSHSYPVSRPEKYMVAAFNRMDEELDIENIFSSRSEKKRVKEKDIKELLQAIPEIREGLDAHTKKKSNKTGVGHLEWEYSSHWIEVHKKFALPFSCLIFALLGISLGATTRKGGRASGFTLSIVIIIFYYIMITAGENLAIDGRIKPWLGMWGPNILLCMTGLFLFVKSRNEFFIFSLFSRIKGKKKNERKMLKQKRSGLRGPHLYLSFPNLLDRYILRKFLAIFALVFISMLAIFIIINFFEKIDSVYEHGKPISLFFEFIWFKVPEFIHYILPITALASALLALGLMTKFNEITAVKTCGISIYRTVLPIVFSACVVSFLAFYLQENILPYSNKKAEETWNKINDLPPRRFNQLDRSWVMGKEKNRIYYYRYFDPIASTFGQISIFDLDIESWSIKRRIFSEKGFLDGNKLSLTNCWCRDFKGAKPEKFERANNMVLSLEENKDFFLREWKEPDQMGYFELKKYIRSIEERGFETVRFKVDLFCKISFPLASLIMVLLGIPFAFSMGRRGALVGIGLSITIAIIYWGAIGIFKSLGYAGFLDVFFAAWGPNLIFGLAGLYFIFTLRT